MITTWYAIILAGGIGERLWPLSTKEKPKQLLSVNGTETLLQQTIARMKQCGFEQKNIGVLTTQELYSRLHEHCGRDVGFFIAEPASRNTAPAVLWALTHHEGVAQSGYFFIPADHFVADEDLFMLAVKQMMQVAQEQEVIVTMGIVPTSAATEYGYIEPTTPYKLTFEPVAVKRFVEKPNKEKAEQLFEQGNFLWNSGMYAAHKEVFLESYQKYQPEMVATMMHARNYEYLVPLSIDYAISERSDNLVVVPSLCRWSDVGSIERYLELASLYHYNSPPVFESDASGNNAYSSKKAVVFSGVDDVSVIETNDVIAVIKRDGKNHLKALAAQIQKS